MTLLEAIGELTQQTQGVLLAAILVFVRVSALATLLPGFGEQSIPMRFRLVIAIAFSVLLWPLVAIDADLGQSLGPAVYPMILSEAFVGVLLGLSLRIILMALQFAGSIAAQSTSLAQMMGASATPDPMPAIGNILVLTGLALAFALGLHIKVVAALAQSYVVVPMGTLPFASDVADWGVGKGATAFALAFTLSAPFIIASFAYNLTLGVINRAMPQLMVAFIGAPAITLGGILILALAGPALLTSWNSVLDDALGAPFEVPR